MLINGKGIILADTKTDGVSENISGQQIPFIEEAFSSEKISGVLVMRRQRTEYLFGLC